MIVLGICGTLMWDLRDTNAENEEKQEQSCTTQNTKFMWFTQYRLRPRPLQLFTTWMKNTTLEMPYIAAMP